MRIAILGTRGIPAAYGGFETLAWELSTRLAARGHEVTVYCRLGRTDETVDPPAGVTRRFLPFLRGKYLETVSHTGLSTLDAISRGYDAIWLGNVANAIFAGLPRVRGTVVALNVDGIERQRAKWGVAGRLWYAVGERLALVLPDALVADALVIQDYYRERYGKPSALIAYGAGILDREPPPDLSDHGLDGIEAGRYVLYVSRLEPENQADLVIEATAHRRRRTIRRRVQGASARARCRRCPRSPGRRDLRHRLSRSPARGSRLCPGNLGRGHASRARRGHGGRQSRACLPDARERGGPCGNRAAVRGCRRTGESTHASSHEPVVRRTQRPAHSGPLEGRGGLLLGCGDASV